MSSTDLLWGRVGETAVGKHATKSFLEALLNTFNPFLYKGGRLLFSIVLCRAGSCLVGTVRRFVGGPLYHDIVAPLSFVGMHVPLGFVFKTKITKII